MKKLFLLTISLLLALTCTAFAQDAEIEPLYEDLISELTAVLNGQDSGKLAAEEDYSVIFKMVAGSPYAGSIGYILKDVDGNGVRELLIGENYGEPDAGTVLYDMYTIRDGKLLHVFDGWDRNRYYLCSNGNFMNEGSGGAMLSSTSYYIYAKGDLIFIRSVIYDGTMEGKGPWFVSYDAPNIIDNPEASYEEISEDEAMIFNRGYDYEHLELTPFLK